MKLVQPAEHPEFRWQASRPGVELANAKGKGKAKEKGVGLEALVLHSTECEGA